MKHKIDYLWMMNINKLIQLDVYYYSKKKWSIGWVFFHKCQLFSQLPGRSSELLWNCVYDLVVGVKDDQHWKGLRITRKLAVSDQTNIQIEIDKLWVRVPCMFQICLRKYHPFSNRENFDRTSSWFSYQKIVKPYCWHITSQN